MIKFCGAPRGGSVRQKSRPSPRPEFTNPETHSVKIAFSDVRADGHRMAAGHPNVAPYDVRLVTDHGRLQSDSHRINHQLLRIKGELPCHSVIHLNLNASDSCCDS